jgi:hypothetical protein
VDVIATSILFSSTVPITATATYNGTANKVWDDLTPKYAGLGVGTTSQGSEADQIAGTDILHIHFATPVILTGVGTLFDSAHTPFGGDFSTVSSIKGTQGFLLSTTGSFNAITNFVSFDKANNTNGGAYNLSLYGKDFYFEQAYRNPQFYVSALTYVAVPGPLAGAGLPGLAFAIGGLLVWRKKRKLLGQPAR